MSTNRGYDVCVYFDADYLCTGSFYDSFEYFHMFKTKGYDVCLVILTVVSADVVYSAITDKYDVDIESLKPDIHIYNHKYKNILNIHSNVLFAPSMSAVAQMFYYGILIPKRKVVTIWELPADHEFITSFETKRDNVLMLYDDRVFEPYRDYEHKVYNRTLNFDIMKPLQKESRKSCMLNMVTDHKCYPVDELKSIMRQYAFEHYTIFTKDKWYDKYRVLENNSVEVLKTPVNDYMYKFDTVLYLPSARGLDPSPRLLPECKWFNKKVIYHDFGKLKDGGYWRWLDCMDNFASLIMTPEDKIFDIIDDFKNE